MYLGKIIISANMVSIFLIKLLVLLIFSKGRGLLNYSIIYDDTALYEIVIGHTQTSYNNLDYVKVWTN